MEFRILLSASLAAALLCGCVTQPIPTTSIKSGARIGVIDLMKTRMTHTHVGTTVFNNFRNEYERPWKPATYFYDQTIAAISATGDYSVVSVAPSDTLRSYTGDFFDPKWSSVVLDDAIAPELERVAAEANVDLVLILRDTAIPDSVTNTNQSLTGYGLYTRSFAGINKAFVYANIFPVLVEPAPARVVSGGPGSVLIVRKPQEIPGFIFPSEVRALAEADLSQVDAPLRAMLTEAARLTAQELNGQ